MSNNYYSKKYSNKMITNRPTNKVDNNYSEIYPYNFISFNSNKAIYKNEENNDVYTGKIIYEIETKTPLIIPDTTTNNTNYYPFYKIDGKPIIPGSELRGVVRSIYEIVTNSCLSSFNGDVDLQSRININNAKYYNIQSGLLIYKGNNYWALYQAKALRREELNTKNKYEITQFISNTNRKKYWGKLNKIVDFSKEDEAIKGLKSIIEKYIENNNENINKKQNSNSKFNKKDLEKYNKIFSKNCDNDYWIPVYYYKLSNNKNYISKDYNTDKDNYYLSISEIGRYPTYNKLKDLSGIKDFLPCNDINKICPACALFGSAIKESSAGRLSFLDAKLIDDKNINYDKVKMTLLGPKVMNQFLYANNKNNKFYTYDMSSTFARGRKMYWHFKPSKFSINNSDLKSNEEISNSYEILPENIKFRGQIIYKDLTKSELNDLIFSINLWDDKHGQKIGHGKPLGYGSINMKVIDVTYEEVEINNDGIFNNQKKYTYNIPLEYINITNNSISDLKKITDFHELKLNVKYYKIGDRKYHEPLKIIDEIRIIKK